MGTPVTLLFVERAASPEAGVEPLRRDLAAHRGTEVKPTSGGLMAAFASAADAARFAAAALENGSPLRIGINTGEAIVEADPGSGRPDYFGPVVNRAARLCSAAHPGQALVSTATRDAAGEALAALDVADLGEHRLRGLENPERVFQLLPASQRGRRFPPIAAAAALPTNLPPQTSAFVGREKELAAFAALVEGGARILAVTGPAGCGKTRTAVRLASALMGRFQGGAWFVDLAEARSAEDIALAVAAAFGVTLSRTRRLEDAVGMLLEFRPPLVLLLDTCDEVRDAVRTCVQGWSKQARRSVFLMTSRAATGVPGEREARLEPLPFPPAPEPGPGAADRASRFEAVQLFVERALEARPDFRLTDENAPDIARICADLEGLPLAVELAASRIRVLSPAELVKKLGQKFQLLRSARQDTARRQQTLSGAIEWSWDQLSPWERNAFVQASAFAGGFTEEAAAAVIELGEGAPPAPSAVRALVARSLVVSRTTRLGTRFSMYRPIREYAERRRAESGAAVEERHAAWCLAEMTRLERHRRGPGEPEARDRILAELENVFAAFDRDDAVPSRARRGIRMLLSASWIFERFARHSGVLDRAGTALRRLEVLPPEPGDAALRGALHTLLGYCLWELDERERARPHLKQALEDSRAGGDRRRVADALMANTLASWGTGEYDEGFRFASELEQIHRELGDASGVGSALNARGACHLWRGELRPALEAFTEAREWFTKGGWQYGLAMLNGNSGLAWKDLGDPEQAEKCYREGMTYAEDAGYTSLLSTCLSNLGGLLSDAGRFEEALAMFERAAGIDRENGDKEGLARKEGNKAVIFLRQHRYEEALALAQAAGKYFRELNEVSNVATTQLNIAAILVGLDRYDEGLEAAREAREIELRVGDKVGAAHACQVVGQALMLKKEYAESETMLRESLALGVESQTTSTYWHALAVCYFAQVLEAQGRTAEALPLVREFAPILRAQLKANRSWDEDFREVWEKVARLAGVDP